MVKSQTKKRARYWCRSNDGGAETNGRQWRRRNGPLRAVVAVVGETRQPNRVQRAQTERADDEGHPIWCPLSLGRGFGKARGGIHISVCWFGQARPVVRLFVQRLEDRVQGVAGCAHDQTNARGRVAYRCSPSAGAERAGREEGAPSPTSQRARLDWQTP